MDYESDNPERYAPVDEIRRRAGSGGSAASGSSGTLVAVITVLSVGLVIGLAALAYFWNKGNKAKKGQAGKPPFDTERVCDSRPTSVPPVGTVDARRPGFLMAQPDEPINCPPAMDFRGFLDEIKHEDRGVETASNQGVHTPVVFATADGADGGGGGGNDAGGVLFTNEQDAFEDGNYGNRRRKGKGKDDYSGAVKELTDAAAEGNRRDQRGKQGGLKFKYKNLGFQDVGNVHPKNDYKKDESNQCLWDIVMVRLSLINEDFVHKSRYTSGQPFGFKHDILVTTNAFDDEWVNEEADSYGK